MKDYPLKSRIVTALPIIMLGLMTAYFSWFIFFENPRTHYPLDFEGASWISHQQNSTNGYFVRELHLNENVGNAYLCIAATDRFELFINGSKIGTETFFREQVSGIFDITGKLVPGRNIIGISVLRQSYPGKPQLLLKGKYFDYNGKGISIFSDQNWKVSPVEERQHGGKVLWCSELFEHSLWEIATVVTSQRERHIQRQKINAEMFSHSVHGQWIWHPRPTGKSIIFSTTIELTGPVDEAFIGINCEFNYDLQINKTLIAQGIDRPSNFCLYNVQPILHSGKNRISIIVQMEETFSISRGLLVEGFYQIKHEQYHSIPGDSWKVADFSGEKTDMMVTGETLQWQQPIVLSTTPMEPAGPLPREIIAVKLPVSIEIAEKLKFLLWSLFIISLEFMSCLLFSLLMVKIFQLPIASVVKLDGFMHLTPTLLFLFIYFFQIDSSIERAFLFQIEFVILPHLLLLLLRGFEMVRLLLFPPHVSALEKRTFSRNTASLFHIVKNPLTILLLLVLIVIGFTMRIDDLDGISLSHDEISMMQYTDNLLNQGKIIKNIGTYEKPLTTYEILPFSVALSMAVFGQSDYAGRLHSVFWGTMEILLIFFLGTLLVDRNVGLFSALIYTFHPLCIIWSQNLFYPQMTQTLATIVLISVYLTYRPDSFSSRWMLVLSLSFSLMYLSWEGSGFLAIGIASGVIALRGLDFSWLKEKYFWLGFSLMFSTVFLQQVRRLFHQNSYLVIGGRMSNIAFPQLFFLDPMFNPMFYVSGFFLGEYNTILSIFALCGFMFLVKERAIRFTLVVLSTVAFFQTVALAATSLRYAYYLEPLLLVSAVISTFLLLRYFSCNLADKSFFTTAIHGLNTGILISLLFLCTNDYLLKPDYLTANPETPPPLTKANICWNDYKSVAHYMKENYTSGDVVFSMMPHALEYYSGIDSSYSFTTLLARVVFLPDKKDDYIGYRDKYLGNPTLVTFEEFQQVAESAPTTWIVTTPDNATYSLNDDKTIEYIHENFDSLFESYSGKVLVKRR